MNAKSVKGTIKLRFSQKLLYRRSMLILMANRTLQNKGRVTVMQILSLTTMRISLNVFTEKTKGFTTSSTTS